MKKVFYVDAVIQWIHYFKTLNFKTLMSNFIIPLVIVGVSGYLLIGATVNEFIFDSFYIGILTIGTLIIGFSYSMIVSLITSNGDNTQRLKNDKLDNGKVTLFEAMIYKFYFVIINLILSSIWTLIALIFHITSIWSVLTIMYIVITSFFILIEGLTNLISVYRK